MSNSKGNQYPVWGINNNYQVFAVATDGTTHNMSKENFAMNIGVSEDGTVWILSVTPDPDGGGSKLYWSNGDANWNEISTADPGGISISGGTGDSCFFLTFDGEIRSMNTSGSGASVYKGNYIVDFDFGGGMMWAIMPEQPGGIPCLQFTEASNIQWKAFAGNPQPFSISANYQGNCVGIDNFTPVSYSKDGSSTGSAGTGVDGKSLSISFKNWSFVLSTDANVDGNLFYEWQDISGGTFLPMAARGSRIAATYYSKG